MDREKEREQGDKEDDIEVTNYHSRKDTESQYNHLYLMPIGLALGTVFGDMLFGNMATGMVMGLVFGLLLGTVLNLMKKKSKHK